TKTSAFSHASGTDTDQASVGQISGHLSFVEWSRLNPADADLFGLLVKAVGLWARAHDPSSVVRQSFLLGATAAASRDITMQYTHDLLHKAGYDIRRAVHLLLPSRPIIPYTTYNESVVIFFI
ncbi:unnamed protein product, partial [Protopolystoma xenopodis]